MVCKWQVEINEHATRVLARHWPNVRRWCDVRTWPQPDAESVDIICGGFPCQDISNAGKCAGITGERSGLWAEFARIVCELRPKVVVVENVAALLTRGIDRVLGTWPTSGTMRNGKCFRRVPLEFHNRDIEFSLWPTVTSVAPAKNGYNRAGQSCGLVAIRKRAISEGGDPGPLNPQFLEWLAGFPTDWTALPNSETL